MAKRDIVVHIAVAGGGTTFRHHRRIPTSSLEAGQEIIETRSDGCTDAAIRLTVQPQQTFDDPILSTLLVKGALDKQRLDVKTYLYRTAAFIAVVALAFGSMVVDARSARDFACPVIPTSEKSSRNAWHSS